MKKIDFKIATVNWGVRTRGQKEQPPCHVENMGARPPYFNPWNLILKLST